MGREVRRVPKDWEHTDEMGPLFDGFNDAVREWDEGAAAWARGECPEYATEADLKKPYAEWAGPRPEAGDYMPDWPEAERTHYQMYENTTEGTPISPVMESPEALARWLADHKASAFGGMPASYEAWLKVCRGSYAVGLVLDERGLRPGVEALADEDG